jgi:hypothetical protein
VNGVQFRILLIKILTVLLNCDYRSIVVSYRTASEGMCTGTVEFPKQYMDSASRPADVMLFPAKGPFKA